MIAMKMSPHTLGAILTNGVKTPTKPAWCDYGGDTGVRAVFDRN